MKTACENSQPMRRYARDKLKERKKQQKNLLKKNLFLACLFSSLTLPAARAAFPVASLPVESSHSRCSSSGEWRGQSIDLAKAGPLRNFSTSSFLFTEEARLAANYAASTAGVIHHPLDVVLLPALRTPGSWAAPLTCLACAFFFLFCCTASLKHHQSTNMDSAKRAPSNSYVPDKKVQSAKR